MLYRWKKKAREQWQTATWVGRKLQADWLRSREPRVFCNSFQKAGTHLLVNLVAGLPRLHAYQRKVYWHHLTWSRDGVEIRSELLEKFGGILYGEVIRGHVAYHERIAEELRSGGIKHIFIYRDPRDILISHLHWWKRHREIDCWPFRVFQRLRTDEQRLTFLIQGWDYPGKGAHVPPEMPFPDIGKRLQAFIPWLESPGTISVRYENLRSPNKQRGELDRIYRSLYDAPLSDELAQAMLASAAPKRSKTFRSGEVGGWRDALTRDQIDLIRELAGEPLIRLGYETTTDWC